MFMSENIRQLRERMGIPDDVSQYLPDPVIKYIAELESRIGNALDVFQANSNKVLVWDCGFCGRKHRVDHNGICRNIIRLEEDNQTLKNIIEQGEKDGKN